MRILSTRMHANFVPCFCCWGCPIHLLYYHMSYALTENQPCAVQPSSFTFISNLQSGQPSLTYWYDALQFVNPLYLPTYLFNGMKSFLEVTDGVINDQINFFTSTLSTYLPIAYLKRQQCSVCRFFVVVFTHWYTKGQLVSPWFIYSQRQTFIADYWNRERARKTTNV